MPLQPFVKHTYTDPGSVFYSFLETVEHNNHVQTHVIKINHGVQVSCDDMLNEYNSKGLAI